MRAEVHMRQGPTTNKKNPNIHSSGVMSMIMPGGGKCVTHVPKMQQPARGGFSNSSSLQEALFPQSSRQQEATNAASTQVPQNFNLSRVPLHMKIGTSSDKISASKSRSGVSNPYAKNILMKAKGMQSKATSNKNSVSDILGEALAPKPSLLMRRKLRAKTPLVTASSKEPQRKRNLVHMEGFDGQVQVPKPNALFKRVARPANQAHVSICAADLSVKDETSILDMQRQLREKLYSNKCKTTLMDKLDRPSQHEVKRTTSQSTSNSHGLWDNSHLSERDRLELLSAKSNYSIEANAETYVQNRQAVVELEKKENSQLKREARKEKLEKAIRIEYICQTCKKSFAKKPLVCFKSGHTIKKRREIRKSLDINEKRLNLNKKSLKDGGLVLGAGLEWSDWRRA